MNNEEAWLLVVLNSFPSRWARPRGMKRQSGGQDEELLNRLNTISQAMLQELAEALLACNSDSQTRAIILTSSGRAFYAGLSLQDAASEEAISRSGFPQGTRLDQRNFPTIVLRDLDTPVICVAFRTGEPLEFIGKHYRFTRLQPFFNPGPIDAPDPPIMLGAVGPKMLSLAGECADWLLTHPSSAATRCLRQTVRPNVELGRANRSELLAMPRICVNELVATGRDEETVARERARYRDMLAFVLSTPAYWASLELFGWKSVGERLLALARQKRWNEMAGVVPDELVDEFIVSGLYEQLPSSLASRFGGLVDRISMPVPADPAEDDCVAAALPAIRRAFQQVERNP